MQLVTQELRYLIRLSYWNANESQNKATLAYIGSSEKRLRLLFLRSMDCVFVGSVPRAV